METPVHIEFQGMEPQEKLHAAIARHVAELEKRFVFSKAQQINI